MNAAEREQALDTARTVDANPNHAGPTAVNLARGLLAEHAEVLAGRKEIARLKDNATTSTALALKNATDFARDLTATQGTLRRLRAAILAGAADTAQAEALAEAADVLESDVMPESMCRIAAALIALVASRADDRAAVGVIVRICEGIRGEGPNEAEALAKAGHE